MTSARVAAAGAQRRSAATRSIPALLASVLVLAATPARSDSDAPAGGAAIEEVTVTGERPGPELWKVSKGDHTLWILGTLNPLPKRMTWRSKVVDGVIARSELVLPASPSVTTSAGPFALIALYFDWRRVEHLPGGSTLRDSVPAPLYARFEVLRTRFAPRDASLEQLRPIVAAEKLFEKALTASGLSADREVENSVLRSARRQKVPVGENRLRVDDPRGILAELGTVSRAAELSCLEATIRRLENDLPSLRDRATAWAVGDVEALRRTPSATDVAECWDAVEVSPRLHALVEAARAQRVRAIDDALESRRTTLALVPIDQLIKPEGLLDHYRARGFVVEGP